jgi:hypothetical protein
MPRFPLPGSYGRHNQPHSQKGKLRAGRRHKLPKRQVPAGVPHGAGSRPSQSQGQFLAPSSPPGPGPLAVSAWGHCRHISQGDSHCPLLAGCPYLDPPLVPPMPWLVLTGHSIFCLVVQVPLLPVPLGESSPDCTYYAWLRVQPRSPSSICKGHPLTCSFYSWHVGGLWVGFLVFWFFKSKSCQIS